MVEWWQARVKCKSLTSPEVSAGMRWMESSGVANDISGDGQFIVGNSFGGGGSSKAFLWDDANGMRSIEEIIEENQVQADGWLLQVATGISDDGSVTVGECVNPNGRIEGWILDLNASNATSVPEPGSVWIVLLGCVMAMIHRLHSP